MADINLNDLLEKKQADSQKALPAVDEKHEVAHFNAQVESLTPEERQQVDTIKDAIDLVNSNAIVQYGSAAQKNIATFSDSVLSTVKSTDPAAAGDLLNDLVKRVKSFEDENDEDQGFLASLPVAVQEKRSPDPVLYDAGRPDRQDTGRPGQPENDPHEGHCHVRRPLR